MNNTSLPSFPTVILEQRVIRVYVDKRFTNALRVHTLDEVTARIVRTSPLHFAVGLDLLASCDPYDRGTGCDAPDHLRYEVATGDEACTECGEPGPEWRSLVGLTRR